MTSMPGVAQRARDDLGAAVVAVEARLGDDDSQFSHHSMLIICSLDISNPADPAISQHHQMIGTSSYSPQTSRSASHISPTVA